jgi:hypothetical protein
MGVVCGPYSDGRFGVGRFVVGRGWLISHCFVVVELLWIISVLMS